MHEWGDEWFKEYGDQLYEAIHILYKQMYKYKIVYYNKEKWGCNDVEYIQFWDGSLYTLLFGDKTYPYSNTKYSITWLNTIIKKFHEWIYCTLDKKYTENKSWWKGLCYYNRKIGLVKLITNYQKRMYNKVYQEVCKKYPDIIEELIISDDYGYEYIKPCKYGNVNGKKIYLKYIKEL